MLKISNLNKPHEYNHKWSDEKRIEAVTLWLAIGNLRIVSATTGIGYQLLRYWRGQPWWKEFEYEIKNAKRAGTKDKLSKIVDKALDLAEDRLENGDIVLNNKTGELVRKPVQLRDITQLANTMLERQDKLDKIQLDESALQTKDTMADTLKLLAEEFAKFNGTRRSSEVIDVEDAKEVNNDALHEEWQKGLQEGEREIQLQTGTGEEEGGEEYSSERILQRGLSPQGGW